MGKVLFIVLFSLLFAGCVLWDDIDTLRERARGREEPEIELDYNEEGEEEVSEGEEEEEILENEEEEEELPPTSGLAFELIDSGTAYEVSGGTAINVEVIIIPAVYNGLPVREISEQGFVSYEMTSVTIPSSVTTIGYRAFADCTGLTSMMIPASVTSINSTAFSGCTGLTSINVDANNPNYASQNEVLYNKAKTQLIQAPIAGISGSFVVPDSVTSIGNEAFSYCTGLASMMIPISVTSIGNLAFQGCTNLTTVFYGGANTTAWSAITINADNTPLTNAARYYYSATQPFAANTYWRWVAGAPIIWGSFIEMVWVPGGSFELGREIGTAGSGDTTPVSTATLTGFHIGKYEVTQEQYQAVTGTNPSYFSSNPAAGETQGRRPVEMVSWYDAIVFCNKLSVMEGLTPAYRIDGETNPDVWISIHGAAPTSWIAASRWNFAEIVPGSTGYRLPTEAQWEYAAKGGNNPPAGYTYSGSNNADEVAWYTSNSGSRTREVGRLAPNNLGLYDMSGNVWEWCWDWYGNYTASAKTNPMGASSGSDRMLRGGNWYGSPASIHSVIRGNLNPNSRYYTLGIRLVRP